MTGRYWEDVLSEPVNQNVKAWQTPQQMGVRKLNIGRTAQSISFTVVNSHGLSTDTHGVCELAALKS